MPTLHSEEISPYSPEQLFALVADVPSYPQFLPWCKGARILSKREDGFDAQLVISFLHLTERYTSRVTLHPHHAIEVDLLEGPFTHLENRWRFEPLPEGGTRIELDLDFTFRSHLLEKMISGLFEKATAKMAHAFKERADSVYGN